MPPRLPTSLTPFISFPLSHCCLRLLQPAVSFVPPTVPLKNLSLAFSSAIMVQFYSLSACQYVPVPVPVLLTAYCHFFLIQFSRLHSLPHSIPICVFTHANYFFCALLALISISSSKFSFSLNLCLALPLKYLISLCLRALLCLSISASSSLAPEAWNQVVSRVARDVRVGDSEEGG